MANSQYAVLDTPQDWEQLTIDAFETNQDKGWESGLRLELECRRKATLRAKEEEVRNNTGYEAMFNRWQHRTVLTQHMVVLEATREKLNRKENRKP